MKYLKNYINKEAMKLLLDKEGLYSNHINDSGGETFCGITRKYYPKAPFWSDLDKLPKTKQNLIDIKDKYADYILSIFITYADIEVADYYDLNDQELVNLIFLFSVNAGKLRCRNICRTATSKRHLVGKIIEYYKSISVGKNTCFARGWRNRVISCVPSLGKEVRELWTLL